MIKYYYTVYMLAMEECENDEIMTTVKPTESKWFQLYIQINSQSTEVKTAACILGYIIVFVFFNYYSSGSLMQRFYSEMELHHTQCMTRHSNWTIPRGICRLMNYTVCPILFSSTLLVILIFEYIFQGLKIGLKSLCGKWCMEKMSNK